MSISNSFGAFSTLEWAAPAGISPGVILIARGGQTNSHNWQLTHFSRPSSSITRAGAPR